MIRARSSAHINTTVRSPLAALRSPCNNQHASRPKVFALAFSIGVRLGIRPVPLVVSSSSWVRSSLANGIHLLLFSLVLYKHQCTNAPIHASIYSPVAALGNHRTHPGQTCAADHTRLGRPGRHPRTCWAVGNPPAVACAGSCRNLEEASGAEGALAEASHLEGLVLPTTERQQPRHSSCGGVPPRGGRYQSKSQTCRILTGRMRCRSAGACASCSLQRVSRRAW
jgi:hypothetical protein